MKNIRKNRIEDGEPMVAPFRVVLFDEDFNHPIYCDTRRACYDAVKGHQGKCYLQKYSKRVVLGLRGGYNTFDIIEMEG